MLDDESGVATSHWLCRAAPDAFGWATSEVGGFAGAHGSSPTDLETMAAAVSDALVEVFDAESASHAGTDVDAATDGLWLTVRLEGPGSWPEAAVRARLSALADRVEWAVDDRSGSVTALFEFPSDAGSCPMQAPGRASTSVAHTRGGRHRCTVRRRRTDRWPRGARRRRPA